MSAPEAKEAAATRPPGRPRSAQADSAILRATIEVFLESGLEGLSMERVAARAGVGKATLYRRAGSKEELLMQAYALIRPPGPPDDTGSLEGDMQALAAGQQARALEMGRTMVPRMIAAALSSPELHALFLERNIGPFREVIGEFVRRGIARGELRPDLDIEATIDLIHGPIVYRVILAGGFPEGVHGLVHSLAPMLLEGLAAKPAKKPRRKAT